METISIVSLIRTREKRSNQLYHLFFSVFVITSIAAAGAVLSAFLFPDYFDEYASVRQYTSLLYATVIAEVAAAIFALSRDLFGTTSLTELKALEERSTDKNTVIRALIDTLELVADGNIDPTQLDPEQLRNEYLPKSSDLGPVR